MYLLVQQTLLFIKKKKIRYTENKEKERKNTTDPGGYTLTYPHLSQLILNPNIHQSHHISLTLISF